MMVIQRLRPTSASSSDDLPTTSDARRRYQTSPDLDLALGHSTSPTSPLRQPLRRLRHLRLVALAEARLCLHQLRHARPCFTRMMTIMLSLDLLPPKVSSPCFASPSPPPLVDVGHRRRRCATLRPRPDRPRPDRAARPRTSATFFFFFFSDSAKKKDVCVTLPAPDASSSPTSASCFEPDNAALTSTKDHFTRSVTTTCCHLRPRDFASSALRRHVARPRPRQQRRLGHLRTSPPPSASATSLDDATRPTSTSATSASPPASTSTPPPPPSAPPLPPELLLP